MEQLSGLDASFIYAEMANTPMHIGSLMIYDPSTAPNGFVRFKDILRTFEERLERTALFRRKLFTVPFYLDQPYWVEDHDFDLEFHLRHIALPQPGDWRQLCILVARLHSRPLDRSRPLWEAYVIEGLDNVEGLPPGCFALFLKVHHACIDGASGVELISAIHDLKPRPGRKPAPAEYPPHQATAPTAVELLWRAGLANLRSPLRIAGLVADGIPAWQRVQAGLREKKLHSLGEKERTRFNRTVTPHRVFGAAVLPLDEVRRIKQEIDGATVNDVILSVIGGAQRRYLQEKGELPQKSLVTGAPVNVRDDSEVGTGGNVVSMMSISLCSDVADPAQRLKAVHEEAVASKAYHHAMGARLMTDVTMNLPSQLTALAFRAAAATGLMAEMKPIFNTVVTNVPGAQVPLYMSGARLVLSLGAGPCTDGMGLIHPVTSYDGNIAISFQSCREMMPDPGFYEQCLLDEFRELSEAFPVTSRAGAGRKAKSKSKTKAKAKAKARSGTRAKTKAKAKSGTKAKSKTNVRAKTADSAERTAKSPVKSAARPKTAATSDAAS
jgi:diacylglycerol O-acyltransferase